MSEVKVLIIHNTYQHRGGEDSVVMAEAALLRAHGHEVEIYSRSNDEMAAMSPLAMVRPTLWSEQTTRELGEKIQRFRPEVIHSHNTFPLISPSLYWVAVRLGVPVVQTLHNFRLLCLNALFLRDGKVCEDCMGVLPWRGVAHACYRRSRAASGVLAGMLTLHRGLGTYRNKVARYIALNEFCRGKFVEGGLPANKITVKPNFVDWEGAQLSNPRRERRDHFLFVGRLSDEKGVATLAKAMALLPAARLRLVGSGPEAAVLDGVAGVTRLGFLPAELVCREMKEGAALVMPSISYESFGLTIVEAFACGLPVIVSRIGALAEIVREGETGLLFTPGDAEDLADKMAWASNHPEEMQRMGESARKEYERLYTPERNYRLLMHIYREAISESAAHNA